MEYKVLQDKTVLEDETGAVLAVVDYPEEEEGIVNIKRTFVDDCLRGKGIANELMTRAVQYLSANDKKVLPSCSYAKTWFENHQEYKKLLDR
ncbi:MAG: N-acetyltransferase [Clostridiales bacterium]|nr:N-acetyltransferase [Clostridiales bacterium]